jgi:hypothetical protein
MKILWLVMALASQLCFAEVDVFFSFARMLKSHPIYDEASEEYWYERGRSKSRYINKDIPILTAEFEEKLLFFLNEELKLGWSTASEIRADLIDFFKRTAYVEGNKISLKKFLYHLDEILQRNQSRFSEKLNNSTRERLRSFSLDSTSLITGVEKWEIRFLKNSGRIVSVVASKADSNTDFSRLEAPDPENQFEGRAFVYRDIGSGGLTRYWDIVFSEPISTSALMSRNLENIFEIAPRSRKMSTIIYDACGRVRRAIESMISSK